MYEVVNTQMEDYLMELSKKERCPVSQGSGADALLASVPGLGCTGDLVTHTGVH